MRGDRAVGGRDPAHELGVQARRVGRRELAREHDAGLGGAGALLAGDRGDDAAPDVEDVGRALAQQRLVERAVEPGDLLGGVVPRAAPRVAPAGDRGVRGVEQRLVVEQGQMGVEDGRLGVAGARGDRRRGRVAIASRAAAIASSQALALALGRVGRALGRRAGGPAEVARGPDGDPGRGRHAGEHVARRGGRDVGGRGGPRAAAAPAPARRAAAAMPSPKPSSASARSAASASAAWAPTRSPTSVSPKRAPSATTLVRLVARTGAPPPALATRTSAS